MRADAIRQTDLIRVRIRGGDSTERVGEVGVSIGELTTIPGGYVCPWYYVRGTPVVTADHPLYVDDQQGCAILEEDARRIRLVVEAPNDALVECLQGGQALAPLCPSGGRDWCEWPEALGRYPRPYRLINRVALPPRVQEAGERDTEHGGGEHHPQTRSARGRATEMARVRHPSGLPIPSDRTVTGETRDSEVAEGGEQPKLAGAEATAQEEALGRPRDRTRPGGEMVPDEEYDSGSGEEEGGRTARQAASRGRAQDSLEGEATDLKADWPSREGGCLGVGERGRRPGKEEHAPALGGRTMKITDPCARCGRDTGMQVVGPAFCGRQCEEAWHQRTPAAGGRRPAGGTPPLR